MGWGWVVGDEAPAFRATENPCITCSWPSSTLSSSVFTIPHPCAFYPALDSVVFTSHRYLCLRRPKQFQPINCVRAGWYQERLLTKTKRVLVLLCCCFPLYSPPPFLLQLAHSELPSPLTSSQLWFTGSKRPGRGSESGSLCVLLWVLEPTLPSSAQSTEPTRVQPTWTHRNATKVTLPQANQNQNASESPAFMRMPLNNQSTFIFELLVRIMTENSYVIETVVKYSTQQCRLNEIKDKWYTSTWKIATLTTKMKKSNKTFCY